MYHSYLKFYAPQINLPYPRCVKSVIFEFYENLDTDKYQVKCKECGKLIIVLKGSHVTSSYTSGLTFHLQTHPNLFQEYLDQLKLTMVPDNKTIHEHFKARDNVHSHPSNIHDEKRFEECDRNYILNPKNCAGVKYIQRDIEIYKNNTNFRHQNEQILEHLYKFTNRNIPVGQLKVRSNSFIENHENILLDLERLFCPQVCFFDPKYYDDCPYDHAGDISIFAQPEYQSRFEGFVCEIEQYPEFQNNKSFNIKVLKEAERIENDNLTVLEMNRLLKIILSILTSYKPTIKTKFQSFFSNGLEENSLLKPTLGVQLWGPSFKNCDINIELDASESILEKEYSTFRHVKNDDCPSYTDNSKKTNETARFINGKAYYPCNFASCLEPCACMICDDSSEMKSFVCSEHNIDHPEMFNETEDLFISRRKFVKFDPDIPIFERPEENKFLCPPKIELAQMKKSCQRCMQIFNDHVTNHHILHGSCQICSHLKSLSEISFKLTCHICLRKFKDKYILSDHIQIHSDDNPNYCDNCQKGFSTKFNFDNHNLKVHGAKDEEFNCDQCEKIFTSQSNLTRHRTNKHTEEKPHFNCQECGAIFERNDTLLRHKRTHHDYRKDTVVLPGVNSEVQPFSCYICDKICKDKQSVVRHIERNHTNKMFSCDLCEKQYSRNDTLQLHISQTHNDQRRQPKIICEVCRQEFPSKPELRKHRLKYHENV